MKEQLKEFTKGMFVVALVLVVILGFMAVASFYNRAEAATFVFQSNLFYGMENTDVLQLQVFLTAQNDYAGPQTGNFYSLTKAGVEKFQGEHGLPTTGYFGVLSRGVANTMEAAQDGGTNVQASTTTPPQPDTNASSTNVVVPSGSKVPGNENPPPESCSLVLIGFYNGFPQYFPNCTVSAVQPVALPPNDEGVPTTTPTSIVLPPPVQATPQVSAVTIGEPVVCHLIADPVTLRTGERAAAFGWVFGRGTVSTVKPDYSVVSQAPELSGAIDGDVGTLPSWKSTTVFYGPPITQTTTYTLTITDVIDQSTTTCSATVAI